MDHVRKLLPVLSFSMRKGSCGRIGVIGGSLEYTGAPYYAAISAMKLGGDLCHVFCCESAAPVIKSYSPSLIVHPGWQPEVVVKQLSRMDCLVLGPGLGRDPSCRELVDAVLRYAQTSGKPTVIDADGIFWVCELSSPVHLHEAIFTPNKGEMDRMSSTFIGKRCIEETDKNILSKIVQQTAVKVGTNIYLKGAIDIFSTHDGIVSFGETPGGVRRCGGQGDLTAGTLALFAFWAKTTPDCSYLDACAASSELVRTASKRAYLKIGRSVETSDIISEITSILREIDGIKG